MRRSETLVDDPRPRFDARAAQLGQVRGIDRQPVQRLALERRDERDARVRVVVADIDQRLVAA